jgi:hypothetical protein
MIRIAFVTFWMAAFVGLFLPIAFIPAWVVFFLLVTVFSLGKLTCPYCKKRVKLGAKACHHCGREVKGFAERLVVKK